MSVKGLKLFPGVLGTLSLVLFTSAAGAANLSSRPTPHRSPPQSPQLIADRVGNTQLEEVRITTDGIFLRTVGASPSTRQKVTRNGRRVVITLGNTTLSSRITRDRIAVDRFGVEEIHLEQDGDDLEVKLDLEEGTPSEWQVSVNPAFSGVAIVPARSLAATQPTERPSEDSSPSTDSSPLSERPPARPPLRPPLPPPSRPPVSSPPTSRPSETDFPNVADRDILAVIDPGHGGRDPGAVGINGLRETDVVLPISLRVAQLLRDSGVQIIMTRSDDREVDLEPSGCHCQSG